MKVLLLGAGGREHALAWSLTRDPSVELLGIPGNPGIGTMGDLLPGDPSDIPTVLEAARRFEPHLVLVGPEAPLVAGIGDALRQAGYPVFGPDNAAARIEGSKRHAKALMAAAGIPTARAASFSQVDDAVRFMDELGAPYVIKADGLAAGKGVVVTSDRAEAIEALRDRLERGSFGAAGDSVLVEEFLEGEETSLIAFTDGTDVAPCEPAQDYKRALDADAGPNTGGMGSYSPVPACSPDLAARIVDEVIVPMVRTTASRGAPFVGALYAGLALTPSGPRVIEFNARFGDPETQALLPRLTSNLADVCLAAATGSLAGVELAWSADRCVSVVLASGGYPGPHDQGLVIDGVEDADARPGVQVFHAGTAIKDGSLVTSGGRVLAVSALGSDFAAARRAAYDAAEMITFEGKHARSDIGERAIEAEVSA
ncbi:MAG: phosphoribosylamine--glycine ligase [Actinomycetota bacterium]